MKKLLLLIVLFAGFSYTTQASHGVGGDTRFIQTGANSFTVVFRFFRYCTGISVPASLTNARILDNVTNASITTFTANKDSVVNIIFGDECYTPPGLCVEAHYYSGTVNLANNPNGYYVTWTTCCRNNPIVNVASTGNVWYTQIPDPAIAGGNSSPKFVEYPRDGYFCIGFDKIIDFSCTDPDGDSLRYTIINPFDRTSAGGTRPFTLTGWNAGFNLLNVLGPGSLCVIDPATGLITARPAQLGLYVISVKCEEFRGGVKIGEVVRDIQYSALNCTFNILPSFEDFLTIEEFKFDDEGCFDIVARDANAGDTFFIDIQSNAYAFGAVATLPTPNSSGLYDFAWLNSSGNTDTATNVNVRKLTATQFEGVGTVGVRFCWNLDNCEILSVDSFYVEALGYSLGCDGSKDTVSKRVSIPILRDDYSYKVPNVFSPNGDGVNDEFYLKKDAFDRCYDALTVRVYNRWGQKVYESDDAKFTWNGRDESGNELVEGTYFVILQGYYGGKEVTQNFPVTLFR
ncbi:MAG: gliding motility-associated C-terminal domain-containing protein [Flavobacteriales bacterium]